jgi:hypothetical protein
MKKIEKNATATAQTLTTAQVIDNAQTKGKTTARANTSATALVNAILDTEKGALRIIDKKLFANFIEGLEKIHNEIYLYKTLKDNCTLKNREQTLNAQLNQIHSIGKQTFALLGDFKGVKIKLSTVIEKDDKSITVFEDFYAHSFYTMSFSKSAKLNDIKDAIDKKNASKRALDKNIYEKKSKDILKDIDKVNALKIELKALKEEKDALAKEDYATGSKFNQTTFDYFLPRALITLRNCIKKAQTVSLEDIQKAKDKRAKERAKKREEIKKAKRQAKKQANTTEKTSK